jgi:hypothetical protein
MTGKTPPESADETASVTLEDFCKGLSAADKRVELIGGFHSDEIRNDRLHDTASAYQERFEAFAVRPVK